MIVRFRPTRLGVGTALSVACCVLIQPATAQPFTFSLAEHGLVELNYGGAAFADMDADGDLDLVAVGNRAGAPPFALVSFLAINRAREGSGSVTEERVFGADDVQVFEPGLWHGTVTWTDMDGDNRPDFLLSGARDDGSPFVGTAQLFRNVGGNTFEEVESGITGAYGGSAAWGDLDGDGDLDLLYTGVGSSGIHLTHIYLNRGDGRFAFESTDLPALAFGIASLADVDQDGIVDLLLGGVAADGGFLTRLYYSDGRGSFSDSGVQLPGLAFGSADWGDFDNDGDLDLLLSGGRVSENLLEGQTLLFRNDAGSLVKTGVMLRGVVYGSATFIDFDLDGWLDVLVVGEERIGGASEGRLYRNLGDGSFSLAGHLPGAALAHVQWADLDADGDADLLVSGIGRNGRPRTALYRNTQYTLNAPPRTPTASRAVVEGTLVHLTWEPDAHNVEPRPVTYNIRVGSEPGETDVVSPLADPATGRRYVPGRGNADASLRRTLQNLSPGRYFWSVQCVDGQGVGSPFSDEQTFVVEHGGKTGTETDVLDGSLPARLAILPPYPNPASESVAFTYDLPAAGVIDLALYDVLGRRVSGLRDGTAEAGRDTVTWDARDATGARAAPGVYFVRLHFEGTSRHATFVLTR